MKAIALAGVVVLVLSAPAPAQSKTDISGAWLFTMQNAAGALPAQVTLKADGARLTGHIISAISGEQSFVGVIDDSGSGFQFSFDGDACSVMVAGHADDNDTLKGTFDNPGSGGAGTFTAKRKEK
jgi:hypothetical protein